MIHVLMCVYNEGEMLPHSVDTTSRTIRHHNSQFYFVDGRYPDFPGESPFSTDTTRGYAIDSGILIDAYADECTKRTEGLRVIDRFASPGDQVLVVDGDECINSLYLEDSGYGTILFTRDSDGSDYLRCRLYPWRLGLYFDHRHYDLWWEGAHVATLTHPLEVDTWTNQGSGVHHDTMASSARRMAKALYYRRLTEKENHAHN